MPRLVYLANPDNPMGSWHKRSADIAAALDHLPAGCLLLLDEAYVECAPEGTAAPVSADDTAGDPDADIFQGLCAWQARGWVMRLATRI